MSGIGKNMGGTGKNMSGIGKVMSGIGRNMSGYIKYVKYQVESNVCQHNPLFLIT